MTLSTKPTDRARRLANFWKQIEENDKVRSVYGGSVLRIERNGQVDAPVGLLGRNYARGVTTTLSTKPTDRARHLANFWKQIEENDKVRSVYGGSVGEA